MIVLRRLHRFFGRTRAVNDVSFEVYQGQVFGYIGPNGAGKTTSMRILATLDVPTAGDALVDGFSVINDPDRVRRRLGFMPDYFGTYPNVNCEEYLDFFARAYGLVGRERHRAVQHTMRFTGLDVLREKPINGLSKGMKQRLCLGRSMVHDPGVLILDEPAAGLDPRARIELREMIGQLAADGKTCLVSSHILTELAEMCDIVGIIEQGQMLAMGTVDEIQHGGAHDPDGNIVTEKIVKLRVLERTMDLVHWLEARDDLDKVTPDGELISFTHWHDRNWEAAVLKDMIDAGYRVASFAGQEKSLEDVFLQVTRGRVQ